MLAEREPKRKGSDRNRKGGIHRNPRGGGETCKVNASTASQMKAS